MKNDEWTPAVMALHDFFACAEDNGWSSQFTLSQLKSRINGETGSQMADDTLSALAPLMRAPDPPVAPALMVYHPRVIHGSAWYQHPVPCGDVQDAVQFERGICQQIRVWRAGGIVPTSDFSMRPWSMGEISQELERLGWVRQGYAGRD